MTAVATLADPLLGIATDFVRPDFHQTPLALEDWLQREKKLRLSNDNEICPLSLLPPGCPLGSEACPLRHVDLKTLPEKLPQKQSAVCCRHWLRGMCKLAGDCPFLHDFNLRRYPECHLWTTYGRCAIGSECLYYHRSDEDWRGSCPDYERGFCPRGPGCPMNHTRKTLCPAYLAGFCPDGPKCKAGHPSPSRPPPSAYIKPSKPIPDHNLQVPIPAGYGRSLKSFDPSNVIQDRTAALGGALSAWREGGGMLAVNARRNDQQDEKPRRSERNDSSRPRKWVQDLSTVLCFRCGEKGHFADQCRGEEKPGDRGGLRYRRG
ncbi:hypothetical protein BD324DRAFT_614589 [Kockovaella imperatae]|uniref:mRNA 3'-end-processing protein n=1 Tax=Kockovaella imperatae TaxID=4999 RepID=A0A1Y1UNS0_9TREE|nr:hypothetical protein BD324DRAFT_614589 [Kockovaella imperatae]ORX39683.1 hypothetical protein BD324DRAFT_614589 [Kockovaella imperatae]